MALRLSTSITKGEIDNRLEGHVMGRFWFIDREQPVCLSLTGNCLRDIAGTRLSFTNPSPMAEANDGLLAELQEGQAGEMTASRKVQMPGMSVEEAYRARQAGKEVPTVVANAFYLEWFSDSDGRVVIESADFQIIGITEPTWVMTRQQQDRQQELNRDAIRGHIHRMANERGPRPMDDAAFSTPMNEFEWEQGLRESDALTDKYSELLDKYMNHPDQERLVAREMGWVWLEDMLDADERGVMFGDEEEGAEEADDTLEPNPLTEGRDWVRTDEGRVKHPLSHHAFQVSMEMWHFCKELGLLDDEQHRDLQAMLFDAQMLGAKLAGALDSLAYDEHPEGGFVVACLKRALPFFNKAISASDRVREQHLLPGERLETFRKDLFDIRAKMLNLMRFYRRQER